VLLAVVGPSFLEAILLAEPAEAKLVSVAKRVVGPATGRKSGVNHQPNDSPPLASLTLHFGHCIMAGLPAQ